MAEIQVQFHLDDHRLIPKILDAVAEISGDVMPGLMIDGELRDPDDPESSLFE